MFKEYLLIVSFKSKVLKELWLTGDTGLLPSTYVYDVIEILDLLDASESITDLELLGGFKIDEYQPSNWAVTVTVNSVEPIGSVTCYYKQSKAYDVDLNEYD
jgi:plasmid maintenance system killer protein